MQDEINERVLGIIALCVHVTQVADEELDEAKGTIEDIIRAAAALRDALAKSAQLILGP